MKKNNYTRRLVALLMVMVMTMCMPFSTVAFAAETNEDEEKVTVITANPEGNDVTLEEALDILGATEDEVAGASIYVMDVPFTLRSTNGELRLSPANGSVHVGDVTFTGSNVGGTLLVFENTRRVQFGARWTWLNPDERTNVVFRLTLTNVGGGSRHDTQMSCGFGDGEYNDLYSEKVEVSSDYTYHFEYGAWYGYWAGEDFEPIQIYARVAILCFSE